ncbi:uncharacterized protein LOC112508010 isoform X2 [Cynara cardunculus var. scolymus]|uniref:uncharacterized protein LOC112508010 isoform X2 n=1 Tax=Cynara cardunculus var. scolymus TaxID=59895 RepID=UPI000D62BADE|nr:uncharacterized protein LOC112508010 isoform X2 [Cynara cardunculus var. scolymus]
MQLLEKALNECGDDIETAIKSLTELRLGTVENFASVVNSAAGNESNLQFQTQANGVANGDAVPVEHSALQSQPVDGADWVNLFVREMLSASNMDDARTRASRALELLEKSITERVTADASSLQQDNVMMKEQLQVVIQENALLKRAVTIQHERRKEFEDRDQELHNLKQMVSQYQEQLRTLEVNNYSLTMNLKQAQQGSPSCVSVLLSTMTDAIVSYVTTVVFVPLSVLNSL